MLKPENWTPYPNFQPREFQCSHTGIIKMDADFMAKLQALRTLHNRPLQISSGYRHPSHPIEAAKASPGPHSTGRAADVLISGAECHRLITLALACGFTGIGVNQKGAGRFIHLDTLADSPRGPRPTIWSY